MPFWIWLLILTIILLLAAIIAYVFSRNNKTLYWIILVLLILVFLLLLISTIMAFVQVRSITSIAGGVAKALPLSPRALLQSIGLQQIPSQ